LRSPALAIGTRIAYEMGMRSGKTIAIVGAVVILLLGIGTCTTYNRLISLDQDVKSQWAQVESVYQRRADLIPNLVATVKGAASFEQTTLTQVTEARAKVGQVSLGAGNLSDPQAFQRFQQAQDALSTSLSRLLAVSESYPQLTATAGFRDLQAQIEGTENRIAVERMRYNEVARTFNTARNRFPASLAAGFFGDRFREKQFFTAQAGAAQAPQVKF
jgi:LemA protein